MIEPDFDVAVIGAGPAGSTAALAMLNSGLRVALIDLATFPRDKTCGDAVAAYAPKVLATISPAFSAAFQALPKKQSVHTCRVVAPNGRSLDFKFHESGNIVKRSDLDNFLYELAIGQMHVIPLPGRRVNSIAYKPDQNFWELQTSQGRLTARLIIGCDGANSVIKKQLSDGRLHLQHHSAAVRAYYKGVEGVNSESFELHFMKELPLGYFWIFPESDGSFNVGLGALSKFISDKQVNLRDLLHHVVTNHISVAKRFANAHQVGEVKGFGLPLGSRKIPISGPGWMLCGDAAHLIDPLTGEGIGQAMASGRYAGWMAVDCFKQQNFSDVFMKRYDRQVYKKFWAAHRKSYLMQRYLVPRFGFFNKLVELAHWSPAFRKWLQRAVL